MRKKKTFHPGAAIANPMRAEVKKSAIDMLKPDGPMLGVYGNIFLSSLQTGKITIILNKPNRIVLNTRKEISRMDTDGKPNPLFFFVQEQTGLGGAPLYIGNIEERYARFLQRWEAKQKEVESF